MKEGVKKSISLILVLTLLVQLLPMVAFGVGDEADDLDISTDSETVSMRTTMRRSSARRTRCARNPSSISGCRTGATCW